MSNLIIKKRRTPAHVFNFYGDLKEGYFTFDDVDETFYSSSINLDQKEDCVWILVPKQLTTGRLIAWPNCKTGLGKFNRLKYHEWIPKEN